MVRLNISPLLISVLTGRSLEEIPFSPNISDLPGNFVPLVAKNLKNVPSAFPSNIQPLVCQKKASLIFRE
ncbi:hypothetical protein [Neobacillus sp.]|uniref:hypothetical protein n=1 Tax=Neobacillus sp. TaxID=2675273 RepID=UPI0028A138C9|nr:hypothetical protein [Neobacillus sp.]